MVHDKDVAASDVAVSDVPSIKDQLTVNAMSGQSRRKGYCIVHTLPIFGFTPEGWVAGESVVQRLGNRECAQRYAGNEAH
jgi:hypothetical protein